MEGEAEEEPLASKASSKTPAAVVETGEGEEAEMAEDEEESLTEEDEKM